MGARISGCRDVVIAGSGPAAAAAAGELIRAGFRPLMLRAGMPARPGAEALPPDARGQIDALGWGEVLAEAGAVEVAGFENHLDAAHPLVKPGPFLHVDRAALAEAALRWAVNRGAAVLDCPRLPPLRERSGGVALASSDRRFFAAIDATGRVAVWSRRRRRGRLVADLFLARSGPDALRGRIIAHPDGWAYRIGLPGSATIGIVSEACPLPGGPDPDLTRRLGLDEGTLVAIGRRPAFPQWSEEPASGRRLAVGDAAFAPDPLSGQGLRFALSSALAAVATLQTLRDGPRPETALAYYREWVAGAVRRHFQLLDRLGRTPGEPDECPATPRVPAGSDGQPIGLPEPSTFVRFVGRTVETGLSIEGIIVPGLAVVLPDGGLVRWLGAFDLLILRDLAIAPITLGALAPKLQAHGLTPRSVESLIRWCVSRGLIARDEAAGTIDRGFPPDGDVG